MSSRRLAIAERLWLPLDWMTLATVVYGARGSGKTTLGAVVAEEVTKAGQRFCAIDLKGDWYGLKSSADGSSAGIPAVVFGGDHKDVPLEEGAGAEVGEIVASLDQPAILDLEYFSKGKQVKFLAAFFERLYDRNRDPLILLMDEAQRYAPQKPISPEASICLGAVEDLVKLGRKHGIGPVLFTQRGSGLNKEVSELCDMLVAFRTPGPLDQDRIKDWLDANTTKVQRDEVMGKLSGLPTGTAVFASGHPDLKVFQVAAVRRRETFDSSATPTVGQRRKEPKRLATPDLEALRTRMAAAIERAKAEDPRELKKELSSLRSQLTVAQRKAQTPASAAKEIEKRVETPVLKDGQLARVDKFGERLVHFGTQMTQDLPTQIGEKIAAAVAPIITIGREITAALVRLHQPSNGTGRPTALTPRPVAASRPTVQRSPPPPRARDTAGGDVRPRAGARRMLEAIARRYPNPTTEGQCAQLAKVKRSGGTFGTYKSDLLRGGFMSETRDGLELTGLGWEEIGMSPGQAAPQTTEDVLALYAGTIRAGARRMADALIDAHPGQMTRADLSERSGVALEGGTFGTYLSDLRKAGLVEDAGDYVGASELLMNPGGAEVRR